jgi:hypothetical protein
MNRAALFVLLLLAAFAPAAPAPDVYSIEVHVISSHFPPLRVAGQNLNVIINGKKYELNGSADDGSLLALGDYKAKLVKDDHKTTYESVQVYEFLFADKKTRKFEVVGQSE